LPGGIDGLAQGDRAAVAQLPGPVAELMTAVIGGVRLHAFEQGVTAENLREGRAGNGVL
jgi:hypothetical protein